MSRLSLPGGVIVYVTCCCQTEGDVEVPANAKVVSVEACSGKIEVDGKIVEAPHF